MHLLGSLRDTEVPRSSENTPEPVPVSVFDPSVNIEVALSFKTDSAAHSSLDGILVLNVLLKKSNFREKFNNFALHLIKI